jgi:hypothetical protein
MENNLLVYIVLVVVVGILPSWLEIGSKKEQTIKLSLVKAVWKTFFSLEH